MSKCEIVNLRMAQIKKETMNENKTQTDRGRAEAEAEAEGEEAAAEAEAAAGAEAEMAIEVAERTEAEAAEADARHCGALFVVVVFVVAFASHSTDKQFLTCARRKTFRRQWKAANEAKESAAAFTLVSYNVLAPSLVDAAAFPRQRATELAWPARQAALVAELRTLRPALLCVQELDAGTVAADFGRALAADATLALDASRFVQRSGAKGDGCALFWRSDVWTLLAYTPLRFRHADDAPLAFLNRDNVGQAAALRHTASGRTLVVGNVHLLYNQSRGEIKLGQLLLLFAELHRLSAAHGGAPIVLAGDFNSTPVSQLYRLCHHARTAAARHRHAFGLGPAAAAPACAAPAPRRQAHARRRHQQQRKHRRQTAAQVAQADDEARRNALAGGSCD